MSQKFKLYLSQHVTPKQWDAVYQKSLIMIQKLGLATAAYMRVHDEAFNVIIPAAQIDTGRWVGWTASEDLLTCSSGAHIETPKYLNQSALHDAHADILRTWWIVSHRDVLSSGYATDNLLELWSGDLGDTYYDSLLVAVGCMIEQELGDQALFLCKLPYDQYAAAAQLATEAMGEEVRLPICCRPLELADRIMALSILSKQEKFDYLNELYCGNLSKEYGAAIRKHFEGGILSSFLKGLFRGPSGVCTRTLAQYFNMGFDLYQLLDSLPFDLREPDSFPSWERTLYLVVLTSLCVDNSEAKRAVVARKANKSSSDVANLFYGMYHAGPIYLSTTEMYVSFPGVWRFFVDRLRNPPRDIHTVQETLNAINDYLKESAEKTASAAEEPVQITDISRLNFYQPGNVLEPAVSVCLARFFKRYSSLVVPKEWKRLLQMSPDALFHDLIAEARRYNSSCRLTMTMWENIYNSLQASTLSIFRYYPMFQTYSNQEWCWCSRAVISNDALWEFCLEKYDSSLRALQQSWHYARTIRALLKRGESRESVQALTSMTDAELDRFLEDHPYPED